MTGENPPETSIRDRLQLFDDSTEQRRRSVLFAIAVCSGFLSVTATSAVVVSTQHVPTIVLMSLLGALSFVFAGFVYAGRFSGLFSDQEMLWKVFDEA